MEAEQPKSLFDIVARARHFDTTKVLIGRIVVVSRVTVDNAAERQGLAKRCEQFLKEHCNGVLGGLLLVYPKYSVHFVETSVDAIVPFAKFLGELEKEGVLSGTRVLQTTDAARTLFGKHHTRCVNIAAGKTAEHKPAESFEAVVGCAGRAISRIQVAECITNMAKLGLFISSLPAAAVEGTLDNLHETIPELLCSQGMLDYLVRAEELDNIPEYLERYAGPVNVVLDNEIVWPHPVRLFPYE